jgi:hypothetical protein
MAHTCGTVVSPDEPALATTAHIQRGHTVPERCSAEISERSMALLPGAHYVLWLDVPVDDPTFVALSQDLRTMTPSLLFCWSMYTWSGMEREVTDIETTHEIRAAPDCLTSA